MQKFTENIENAPFSEFTLDYFARNEGKFDHIKYIISYADYLRREMKKRNADFVIYNGSKASFNHIILGKRYYGNIMMVECKFSDLGRKGKYHRLIQINQAYIFARATLFIVVDGRVFKLKHDEGFLQINIRERETVKEVSSLEHYRS